MRERITDFITAYVRQGDEGGIIPHIWREPLVAFGDARREEIAGLRRLVHPEHDLPENVLPGAKTLIAYFLPFTKEIGNGNRKERLSSAAWAKAYEKTNAFIVELNGALIDFLKGEGVRAAVSQEAGSYDPYLLKSKWSQRHLAYYCGLGTFGRNNMLITAAGECGRISTVVTDLDVPHAGVIAEEYCLYKKDGSCGACVRRCPVGALSEEGYDRVKCSGLCDENAAVHVGYCETPSYTLDNSESALTGSNTCGKCVVGVPCAYRIP